MADIITKWAGRRRRGVREERTECIRRNGRGGYEKCRGEEGSVNCYRDGAEHGLGSYHAGSVVELKRDQNVNLTGWVRSMSCASPQFLNVEGK